MSSTRFLQGIFDFEGGGLHEPFPVSYTHLTLPTIYSV